jgi:hypothetical protein
MSDTDDATKAADAAKTALDTIPAAIDEMNSASTQVAIDAAYAKVQLAVDTVADESAKVFRAKTKANTALADDAWVKAEDYANKAQAAAVRVKTLLDKRRPQLK